MNILEQIHKGKRSMPPRLMLYGVEGVGKSTFGANAPNPIFIPTEDGLGEIDCASFPLAKKYSDVEAYLSALAIEQHDYQTVIIDSGDWLEQLIWEELCRISGVSTIEKCDGGYGKGYIAALGFWRQIVDALDALRTERHMAVILIAHARVERFEDPESSAYDRYSPRLHKHATALLTEWADAVLFATRKFRTESENMGFGKERTIAVGLGKDGGERVIRTVGGPSCIAKNRYDLPYEIPLSWDAFINALNNSNQETTNMENVNNG
ncbi:MAG: ATP-binding protein [Phycisphaerales bacterium]